MDSSTVISALLKGSMNPLFRSLREKMDLFPTVVMCVEAMMARTHVFINRALYAYTEVTSKFKVTSSAAIIRQPLIKTFLSPFHDVYVYTNLCTILFSNNPAISQSVSSLHLLIQLSQQISFLFHMLSVLVSIFWYCINLFFCFIYVYSLIYGF